MLHRPRKGLAVALAALCLLGLLPRGSPAEGSSGQPRSLPPTLIIALPQMTWRGAASADMPSLREGIDHSSVGLILVARASDSDPNRTWVTLGAGRAAVCGPGKDGGLPGGDRQVSTEDLLAANERARTSARPGLLGTRLRERSVSTALIAAGNYPPDVMPTSAAVVMDQAGRVDHTWLYAPVEMTAGGKLLDPGRVREQVASALSEANLVLLDLTGVGPAQQTDAIIAGATSVLEQHAARAPAGRGRLVLLTALAPPAAPKSPPAFGFIAIRDVEQPGVMRLLTSASTRWRGFVTAADFAPTILAYYDALPQAGEPSMSGHVLRSVEARNARAVLDNLSLMMSERIRLAELAGTLYASYMAALAVLVFLSGARRQRFRWMAVPALFGALFPIGLLLAPLAGLGVARQLLVAAGLTIGGALLASRYPRSSQALTVSMLIGAAIIALDVVLGSPLMRQSALGFRAMSGSRFYGLGNEYLGVVGAMLMIGLGAALQQNPRRVGAAVAVAVGALLVIGAPWWGANWGGYVAALIGLAACWVLASRRPVRTALLAVIVVLVGAALPAVLDLLRPAAVRSHIGTAAAALLKGRREVLSDMVWRKVRLNWAVARQAGFWWTLVPIPLIALWLQARRGAPASGMLSRDRLLAAGIGGALIFSVAAMVVNDSGVATTAMALAVVFGVIGFIGARGE